MYQKCTESVQKELMQNRYKMCTTCEIKCLQNRLGCPVSDKPPLLTLQLCTVGWSAEREIYVFTETPYLPGHAKPLYLLKPILLFWNKARF